MPDFRYVGWSEYGRLTEMLAKKVAESRERFDLAVGIARGGVPVAMVVSDRLGLRLDFVKARSYSGIAKRSRTTILQGTTEKVGGRRVLLVDDLVDEGVTMATVARRLAKSRPAALKTAVLFKKPWSTTHPDFFVEETEDWVVFPFETHEVESLRKAEARPRSPKQR